MNYLGGAKILLRFVVTALFWGVLIRAAVADDLEVRIDLSEQSLIVNLKGEEVFVWPVSTGAAGYNTPTGIFRPTRLHETWHSIKYDGIPMPHSIFFFKGYAIHGTLDTRDLGRPASRGCVRLHPENARALFELVKEQGISKTAIIVQD